MDVLISFTINEPAVDCRRSISYLTYSSMWYIFFHNLNGVFKSRSPSIHSSILFRSKSPPFQVMIRSYPCPWVFLLPQHHWSPWTALQLSGAGDDMLGQVLLSFFIWFCFQLFSVIYLLFGELVIVKVGSQMYNMHTYLFFVASCGVMNWLL